MKPFWTYTGLRLVLFAATFGVVVAAWGAFNHGRIQWPLAVALSALISFFLAYPLLMKPRNDFAAHLQARGDRMVENLRSSEDED